MKTTIVLLFTVLLSSPFLGAKVTTLQRQKSIGSIGITVQKIDEKVGQMTQMTVTNFEEKGKPGVLTWLS
jgi:beta-glucosidase